MNRISSLMIVFAGSLVLAGCATSHLTAGNELEQPMYSSATNAGSLDPNEVKDMVEFCVDLDSQDDLMKVANPNGSVYSPRIDPQKWGVVADSRMIVANKKGLGAKDAKNPKLNGFAPFDNAWTLHKRIDLGPNDRPVYVLAIRGTVVASLPSVWEDLIVATVAAKNGMEYDSGEYLPITFAEMPRAEVHAGFAYGAFSILFDGIYGVLPELAKLPPDALLIITGHSQGASIATLTHAVLHYALRDGKFGMKDKKDFSLKSYVFAQPKPGNERFSMDFAEIATNQGNAYVFNNNLDPIPQVPLTIQFLADADEDMPKRQSFLSRTIRDANSVFNYLRTVIDRTFTNRINEMKEIKNLYAADDLKAGMTRAKPTSVSLNYVTAGWIITLHGDPKLKADDFVQHHATTYRDLIAKKYPAATVVGAR